ncbi:hypothetical protein PSTT_16977, partial [Puccinia striiformis]
YHYLHLNTLPHMPEMNNQTAPATNNASKSVDGYATDQSQTGPRRSSRVPTPSKSGSHANTPADSRQSLGNRPNVPRKQQQRGSGSSAGSTHVAPSSQVLVQNTSKRAPLNTQNRSPLRPHTVHKRTIFKPLSLKKTPKGNNRPPSSARPQSSIAPTSDAGALPESTEDYDFNQDSDIEIKEIESQSRNKANTQDDDGNFSFVEDYFEPPTWKLGLDAPGTLLNYKCKWCRVPYQIHGSTRANLKTHCDGLGQTSKNNKGCKQRAKAKTAGHRLHETVIDKILKEDQESIEKSRRKSRHKNNSANDTQTSMYGNISFSPRNWEDIEELNAELEVFVKLTQQMKGNHSSGAHVIPKYLELKEELEDKKQAAVEKKYLDEAMACDSLILATVVHPCFRLSLFTLVFGQDSDEYNCCNSLITQEFARFKDKITTQAAGLGKSTPEAKQKETTGADSKGLMARLALLNKKKPSAQEHELQSFLTADLAFKADDIKDPDFPLKWWKIHPNLYPTVSAMAWSYLATSASCCA